MRIGILTHPLETNYGGVLQAYALQQTLIRMRYDAITIDRHNKEEYPSLLRHILSFGKRLFRHFFLKQKNISIYWNPFISEQDSAYISQNIQKFINRNIRLTRRVFSSELNKIDNEYHFDAYVVGSDQVWLPNYCPNSFLDFVNRKDVIKIFYAASCGATSWADKQEIKNKCQTLALDFKGISVREKHLVDLSQQELGVKAELVLDPTMLLRKEDYISLLDNTQDMQECIFSYILDKSDLKQKIINSVHQKVGIEVKHGNVKKYYYKKKHKNLDDFIFPSIESWLEGFRNAKYIITDSFHGTVFSIIFNKQFVVIGNPHRGMNRFISLLEIFGLTDKLVSSEDEALKILEKPINYNKINDIIERYRNSSIKFIKDHLKQ